MSNIDFLSDALRYGRYGFSTVAVIGKAPKQRGRHGWADATCNPILLREMFSNPHTGLGIACGPQVGWVLDIDGEEGRASLAELVEQFDFLPYGPVVETPGGGQHRWFAWDDRCEILKNRVRFRPGLDVRTKGGGVVVPPSIHPNGGRYRWRDVSVTEYELPVAPDWLLAEISGSYRTEPEIREVRSNQRYPANDRYAEAALASAESKIKNAPNGQQRITLNREAIGIGGNVVATKLYGRNDAIRRLVDAGLEMTNYRKDRWTEKSIEAVVRSGIEYGSANHAA